MLKPRALAPGDRLAVVAPASPFDRDEFDCGIEEIRRLGFVPVYDDSVFARASYVAGPPELRAAAIRAAWRDPAIAGIIGVRGGYGSAQLLPLLDPAEARAARKPFIGYSDLTALLTFHTITCDMVAFHGPMLAGRLAGALPATIAIRSNARSSRPNRWGSCPRTASSRFETAKRQARCSAGR